MASVDVRCLPLPLTPTLPRKDGEREKWGARFSEGYSAENPSRLAQASARLLVLAVGDEVVDDGGLGEG